MSSNLGCEGGCCQDGDRGLGDRQSLSVQIQDSDYLPERANLNLEFGSVGTELTRSKWLRH